MAVCTLNLLLTMCRSSKVPEYLSDSRNVYKCLLSLLFKSLTISSFGKLAVLPLVIWNPNEIFFNLALIFTLLTNSQALSGKFSQLEDFVTKPCYFYFIIHNSFQVTTHMSRPKTLCLVFLAAGMAQLYTQIDLPIDDLFKN